jgi:hypothetical protein
MFSKEETKIVLGFLVPMMVAYGILHLCGYHIKSYGDPIVAWVLLLPWTIYLLYSWKDKKELLKRCVLALPFALLTVLLLRWFGVVAISDPSSWPWPFGVLMFILLTRETKNLKGGFVINLVIGTILISLLSILVILIKSVLAGPVK